MTSHRRAPFSLSLLLAVLAVALPRPASAVSAFPEFVDPNPSPGNGFGTHVVALATGNVAISAPYDDGWATDAGAVYLFNGSTGALISTLSGYTASDRVGSRGIVALTNGNFVVLSPSATIGGYSNAGAATWVNGTSGLTANISSSNSLVGSTADDFVGQHGVSALPNGNYVVASAFWHNGAVAFCGAATFGSGASGVSGSISASNSLVGTSANDAVGVDGVVVVGNSNYVVVSTHWDGSRGAVTWGSGTSGRVGAVSATNSFVGASTSDVIGYDGVVVLTNGNYVIQSQQARVSSSSYAGAVTFGNGNSGVSGTFSSANSLVGSSAYDLVGSQDVVPLSNGNYVVPSYRWSNGAVSQVGAVTWCSGTTGRSGAISAANSLVGTTASDHVGGGQVLALSNGNYVVCSPDWNNGAVADAGAVTWGSGTTGVTGSVTTANSLTSTNANARVGIFGAALTNGHYVTSTPSWDNGATLNVGAVTWGNGTVATSAVVSTSNSLVGSTANDNVGYQLTPLANGHYVVSSYYWNNGAVTEVGAVTWCNGSAVRTGSVSPANSLVGSTASDQVGSHGITLLANNHYVVRSDGWDNGAAISAGAVTWCSQNSATAGVVSSANSLVGTHTNDRVGGGGIVPLSTGHFVVVSPYWDNGAVADAGAVTWCSGTGLSTGAVSTTNSLYGSTASDHVGTQVQAMQDGSWVIRSPDWDNGPLVNAGAATWATAGAASIGAVDQSNSVFGFQSNSGLTTVTLDPQHYSFAARFSTEGSGHVRVGPLSSFEIAGSMDITPDQGGWVRVVFMRSPYDHYLSTTSIQTYGVWRRIPGSVPQLATSRVDAPDADPSPSEVELDAIASSLPAGVALQRSGGRLLATVPEGVAYGTMPAGSWELVATVPAFARTSYIVAVPTITDLTATEFLVTAHTSLNTVWFTTPTTDAQSVDDLAPAQPSPFAGNYTPGNTHLTWGANSENDLLGYRLYRGSHTGFTPSLANRIATPSGTSFDDAIAGGFVYKLTAVDVNGNESPVATVIPTGTTGVEDGPVAFALDGVRPNPARGRALSVAFALPTAAPAKLELLDVSGRRIAVRDVGALGAGRHTVNLSESGAVPSGLYWARLTQGANQRSVRVAVVE